LALIASRATLPGVDARQRVGGCDTELRPTLLDAFGRDLQIEIAAARQFLQLGEDRVVEQGPTP
jgi:hypothetical protein